MKVRRGVPEMNLAFLDVICCGFGAIILLLMITKIGLPLVLEETLSDFAAQVALKQDAIKEIFGEIEMLERAKEESELNLDDALQRLKSLEEELEEVTSRFDALQTLTTDQKDRLADLVIAKQSLTDEMERLLGQDFQRRDSSIGGMTVDSEYIVFIIDTSGSMQEGAWPQVVAKVTEVLNVYPNVKGIQVMNDMGNYMFPRFQGRWIEDSPARRRAIIDRLRSWNIYSNSSPVEGIEQAIEDFYDPDKLISLYVFGDDFRPSSRAPSVEAVVDRIDSVNAIDEQGNRRVRIHGVGFPVYLSIGRLSSTFRQFATLMRELTVRNGGTFVALPRIN